MTDATVRLWGRDIGAVSWVAERDLAVFQFEPEFARSGIELAPLTMPAGTPQLWSFPALPKDAFKGLPGLLADSLPDRFGNALIDTWCLAQGRRPGEFNAVERLCYIGNRGMGALEYRPAVPLAGGGSHAVELDALVALANEVINDRRTLVGELQNEHAESALRDILRVGTSAGGARAKAVLQWNETTGEFRSGQLDGEPGFDHWLLKFDGVHGNRDRELADPMGFGAVEYACYQIALQAGVDMSPSRLITENGRAHFMTRRFDRDQHGRKLHMQSLAAMRHFDFNAAGAYSYEHAVETIRLLDLPSVDLEQQLRRAYLNVVLRNQDDHVKNIAFLMNRRGEWRLAPAFDVTFAYNPQGAWTQRHQMSLQGNRDGFVRDDLLAFGVFCGFKRRKPAGILDEVLAAVRGWPERAAAAGVPATLAAAVQSALRLDLADNRH